jgi:hypothetical protein
VLQVKTMSSHQRRAGTTTWKTSSSGAGRPAPTSTSIAAPQSGHVVATCPSTCSAAGIPNASQAQFPCHDVPPASTRNGRGYCRERVRHPDLAAPFIEHERVRIVQAPKAAVVTQLGPRRRPAELDEAPVDEVPEREVALVHQ